MLKSTSRTAEKVTMNGAQEIAMQSTPTLVTFQDLLIQAEYRVVFRENGWFECLVSSASERWTGTGATAGEALEDVREKMFPSRLSQEMLRHRLGEVDAQPAQSMTRPSEEAALKQTLPSPASFAVASSHAASGPESTVETPRTRISAKEGPKRVPPVVEPPKPEPIKKEEEASISATAEPVEKIAAAAPTTDAPQEHVREYRRVVEVNALETPRTKAAAALLALDRILAEIDDELPRFARLSADRQRLGMLLWICRARSYEESMPEARDVEYKVAKVARRLTDLGKTFWPGSVRALQLSAHPSDVQELRAPDMSTPHTWQIAAERARRLYEEFLAKSMEEGLDPEGWADAVARTPPPPDPDVVLESATAEINAKLGTTDATPELAETDIESLLTVARKLRWIRGLVRDHVLWGTTVGKLRRAMSALGAQGGRVRDALDAKHKPPTTWSALLGEAAEPSASAATIAELVASLPEDQKSRDTLFTWLVKAIDVFNTPDLAGLLQPLKDEVAAIADAAADHEDRRIRRRLRELSRRVQATSQEEANRVRKTLKVKVKPEGDDKEESGASQLLSQLASTVRAHTEGKRALLVSNRDDSELQQKLEELLGMSVSVCDGSVRRVQAQCERIANGSYDIVLSATGFQLHSIDGSLAKAANAASVPYVRVNRGRPLACVQAIAREFGLASSTTGDMKPVRV